MFVVNKNKIRSIQRRKYFASFVTTVAVSVIANSANLSVASETGPPEINKDLLAAVAELHGLSETQAVERLARESEAAITLKHIRERPLTSYAGSWFDADTMKLNVAIVDTDDLDLLEGLNVEPVLVSNSLTELQKLREQASDHVRSLESLGDSVLISYIDFRSNKVVLGIDRQHTVSARFSLNQEEFSDAIEVIEEEANFMLSADPFRAADGTRNLTWQQDHGGLRPCSIGAPVEDGYVTAGHCGYANNEIVDVNQDALGDVVNSQWEDTTNGPDIGYVQTNANWTPTAQVNGYTDGNFDISAEWGGIIKYPVGSTLCRYGQTTGGPNCSTLDQLDVDIAYSQTRTLAGMSLVDASCTSDGDSGGTWVAGAGQIQGIHSGGQAFAIGDQCPTTFDYLFFQPIRDALDEYSVTMLTEHGSNAPDLTDVECPDPGVSTYGRYYCGVNNVDSQGEVSFQWTATGGASSTKTYIVKKCSVHSTISVTLQATNPYGTDTKYYTFPCPASSQ